ncbi:uncharacterized protein LOC128219697 [Mya arenaria]|uniref:uncharacterized protein LOC128219697 n=1 Tax=Mya arenaria TaxID=6604 RepID=UPI0022E1F9D0|nr:uncharacterized protein LOC128219697 [Mya arenaria]
MDPLMDDLEGLVAPDLNMDTPSWCSSCNNLRQEIKKLQDERVQSFQKIKQKIIPTDLLIKKYKSKCDDILFQCRKVDDANKRAEKFQRQCEILEAQLKASLLDTEPLRANKTQLEAKLREKTQEAQNLTDKVISLEGITRQYEHLSYTSAADIDRLESEKRELLVKCKNLEVGKLDRGAAKEYRREIKVLKKEKRTMKRESIALEIKLKSALEKIEKLRLTAKSTPSPYRQKRTKSGTCQSPIKSPCRSPLKSPLGIFKPSPVGRGRARTVSERSSTSQTRDSSVDHGDQKLATEEESSLSSDSDDNASLYSISWSMSPLSKCISPLPPTPAFRDTVKTSNHLAREDLDISDIADELEHQLLDVEDDVDNLDKTLVEEKPVENDKLQMETDDTAVVKNTDSLENSKSNPPKNAHSDDVDSGDAEMIATESVRSDPLLNVKSTPLEKVQTSITKEIPASFTQCTDSTETVVCDILNENSKELRTDTTAEPIELRTDATNEPTELRSNTNVEPTELRSDTTAEPIELRTDATNEPTELRSDTTVEPFKLKTDATNEPSELRSDTTAEQRDATKKNKEFRSDTSDKTMVLGIDTTEKPSEFRTDSVMVKSATEDEAVCTPLDKSVKIEHKINETSQDENEDEKETIDINSESDNVFKSENKLFMSPSGLKRRIAHVSTKRKEDGHDKRHITSEKPKSAQDNVELAKSDSSFSHSENVGKKCSREKDTPSAETEGSESLLEAVKEVGSHPRYSAEKKYTDNVDDIEQLSDSDIENDSEIDLINKNNATDIDMDFCVSRSKVFGAGSNGSFEKLPDDKQMNDTKDVIEVWKEPQDEVVQKKNTPKSSLIRQEAVAAKRKLTKLHNDTAVTKKLEKDFSSDQKDSIIYVNNLDSEGLGEKSMKVKTESDKVNVHENKQRNKKIKSLVEEELAGFDFDGDYNVLSRDSEPAKDLIRSPDYCHRKLENFVKRNNKKLKRCKYVDLDGQATEQGNNTNQTSQKSELRPAVKFERLGDGNSKSKIDSKLAALTENKAFIDGCVPLLQSEGSKHAFKRVELSKSKTLIDTIGSMSSSERKSTIRAETIGKENSVTPPSRQLSTGFVVSQVSLERSPSCESTKSFRNSPARVSEFDHSLCDNVIEEESYSTDITEKTDLVGALGVEISKNKTDNHSSKQEDVVSDADILMPQDVKEIKGKQHLSVKSSDTSRLKLTERKSVIVEDNEKPGCSYTVDTNIESHTDRVKSATIKIISDPNDLASLNSASLFHSVTMDPGLGLESMDPTSPVSPLSISPFCFMNPISPLPPSPVRHLNRVSPLSPQLEEKILTDQTEVICDPNNFEKDGSGVKDKCDLSVNEKESAGYLSLQQSKATGNNDNANETEEELTVGIGIEKDIGKSSMPRPDDLERKKHLDECINPDITKTVTLSNDSIAKSETESEQFTNNTENSVGKIAVNSEEDSKMSNSAISEDVKIKSENIHNSESNLDSLKMRNSVKEKNIVNLKMVKDIKTEKICNDEFKSSGKVKTKKHRNDLNNADVNEQKEEICGESSVKRRTRTTSSNEKTEEVLTKQPPKIPIKKILEINNLSPLPKMISPVRSPKSRLSTKVLKPVSKNTNLPELFIPKPGDRKMDVRSVSNHGNVKKDNKEDKTDQGIKSKSANIQKICSKTPIVQNSEDSIENSFCVRKSGRTALRKSTRNRVKSAEQTEHSESDKKNLTNDKIHPENMLQTEAEVRLDNQEIEYNKDVKPDTDVHESEMDAMGDAKTITVAMETGEIEIKPELDEVPEGMDNWAFKRKTRLAHKTNIQPLKPLRVPVIDAPVLTQSGKKRRSGPGDQAQDKKQCKEGLFSAKSKVAETLFEKGIYKKTLGHLKSLEPTVEVFMSGLTADCPSSDLPHLPGMLLKYCIECLGRMKTDSLDTVYEVCRRDQHTTLRPLVFPLLNNVEKRALHLLQFLHCNKAMGLSGETVFTMLWQAVFSRSVDTSVVGQMSMCRVFTALSSTQGNIERARVLFYHIVTCGYLNPNLLVVPIVSVWPEVLCKSPEDSPDKVVTPGLTLALEEVIKRSLVEQDTEVNRKVLLVLQKLCCWSGSHGNIDTVLKTIMNKLAYVTHPESRNIAAVFELTKAVDLLLSTQPWSWVKDMFIYTCGLQSAANKYRAEKINVPVAPEYMCAVLKMTSNAVHSHSSEVPGRDIKQMTRCWLLPILNHTPGLKSVQNSCLEMFLEISPIHPPVLAIVRNWFDQHRHMVNNDIVEQLEQMRLSYKSNFALVCKPFV